MKGRLVPLLALPIVVGGCEGGLFGPSGGIELEPVESTFLVEPEAPDPDLFPREEPPAESLVDSLFYRAAAVPEDTALGSVPMGLRIDVTVRNPWDREVVLPVRGCTVQPRAHSNPARTGQPVWVRDVGCAQAPYTVTLEPGGSTGFSFLAHDVMLASALPDGRYYFTAEFRAAEATLELPAGSADVRLREPGLEYSVSLRPAGRVVLAEVGVTNRNEVPMSLQYGQCALSLALYRDRARTELAAPWYFSNVCLGYLAIASLRPGETHRPEEFTRAFDAARLTELEPGRYFLTVNLGLNWRTYRFPIGELEMR